MLLKFATTILQVAVHREEEHPVFGEGNTYIKVDDEGGGPFITIEQDQSEHHVSGTNTIRLDYEELQSIQEAAKMLMHQMYIEQADMLC
jgi:hypothetical protein